MKRFLMLASTGLFAASLAVLPMSAFAQGAAVGTDTKAPVPTVQPVTTPVQAPAVKAAAPTTAPTTAAVSAPGIKTPAPIANTTRAMPLPYVQKGSSQMPRRRGLDFGPVFGAVLIVSAAAAQEPAKPEVVHREVVAGMPRGEQQDVQVLRATIAPGQSTGFHTHRFP